jgi:UDP-glucose 4-epimerase
MNKRRILVTGVAGFLGSHLADHLIDDGFEVVGIDNMIGGDLENVNPKVKFSNLDCCDLEKLNILCMNIDIIFHCAATAHEGLSVFSPNEIVKNNFLATTAVVTAGVNNKVKRIIYCSSMARYGHQKTPFTEDMQTNPVDPYGISKVAAEEVLKVLCNLNKIEWVIAVPHNIIGPKQRYVDPYRNVVSIIFNRILQGKKPIIYGDGEQKRCFSYIDDCISCLLKMMDSNEVVGEVINIGPDEEFYSINEIAKMCSNISGSNFVPEYHPDRPLEIKLATCSSDKARRLLNYKTKTNTYDAIKKTYDYIKLKGPKDFQYNINLEINNDLTPSTWKKKIF